MSTHSTRALSRAWAGVMATVIALALGGCQSLGVGSVERDRLGYVQAIGTSWKEQMLLNIVKLRYTDTPVFLDVSSVISSYEVAGQIGFSANVFPHQSAETNRTLGLTGTYADRPTISYTPVTGERYMNSLLRPIAPQAIFAMMEAGHQADIMLGVTTRAINGVFSQGSTRPHETAKPARPAGRAARFQNLVAAFRRLQDAGALSVRVHRRGDEESTYLRFASEIDAEVSKDIAFVREELGIAADVEDIPVVFGAGRRGSGQIAMLTRSLQQILSELSAGVDIPDEDVAERRAGPRSSQWIWASPSGQPLLQVRSGLEPPAQAYASVRYRDRVFWIDDRDLSSKRTFMLLMVLSSLAESGVAPQVPLLTIPAR